MKFGLSENTIRDIHKLFENYHKVSEVIIFGSRVKGDFSEGSDIDLALKGEDLKFKDVLKLSVLLEEGVFPYRFDLLNLATLKDPKVLEHVNRAGKVFFRRGQDLQD